MTDPSRLSAARRSVARFSWPQNSRKGPHRPLL
jgi:hypothetical protein